jgi:hypothetical protein
MSSARQREIEADLRSIAHLAATFETGPLADLLRREALPINDSGVGSHTLDGTSGAHNNGSPVEAVAFRRVHGDELSQDVGKMERYIKQAWSLLTAAQGIYYAEARRPLKLVKPVPADCSYCQSEPVHRDTLCSSDWRNYGRYGYPPDVDGWVRFMLGEGNCPPPRHDKLAQLGPWRQVAAA